MKQDILLALGYYLKKLKKRRNGDLEKRLFGSLQGCTLWATLSRDKVSAGATN
jgi:hypothetical protein